MSVLVVDRVVLVARRARGVHSHEREIHIGARQKEAGKFLSVWIGAVAGEENLQRVFVAQGEDDRGLSGIDARLRKSRMKKCANIFKLGCNVAAVFLSGIAEHNEVRRANFDPILIAVAREGRSSQSKEDTHGKS